MPRLLSPRFQLVTELENSNYLKLPVGKEPSFGRRLPVGKMPSSDLRLPVIPDSAGLRKLSKGFASTPVRKSPVGRAPSSERSDFALEPDFLISLFPGSRESPALDSSAERFFTASCLNEVDFSAVLSRDCSLGPSGCAVGETLGAEFCALVPIVAGESAAAYELFF